MSSGSTNDTSRKSNAWCLTSPGVARGKILPRQKFTEDRGMRLPEAIVAIGVTGEFPEEGPYYDVITPTDRDMHLRPDPKTVRIVPWATDPTAQVIHDCFDRDGKLIPYAHVQCCGACANFSIAEGWQAVVAPELEFLPDRTQHRSEQPLRPPKGRSGRAETSRQAYSIDAVNEFDPLFEDIYDYCEKMELNVDTLIHEVGAGQMEINFFHDDPLQLADEVFFFKRTIRETALRHEMYATFMAKPMAGEPGSAMHVHQSLVDKASGRNIFSNPDGTPSKEFFWYSAACSATSRPRWPCSRPTSTPRRLARSHRRAHQHPGGTDNRPSASALRWPRRPPGASRTVSSALTPIPMSHSPPRWPAATSASSNRSNLRPNARATPTWATTRCRAAWVKR